MYVTGVSLTLSRVVSKPNIEILDLKKCKKILGSQFLINCNLEVRFSSYLCFCYLFRYLKPIFECLFEDRCIKIYTNNLLSNTNIQKRDVMESSTLVVP
jgi:hypothetical protein